MTQEQIRLLEDVIFDCEILRKKLHSVDWCFSDDTGPADMEKDLLALTREQIKKYENYQKNEKKNKSCKKIKK